MGAQAQAQAARHCAPGYHRRAADRPHELISLFAWLSSRFDPPRDPFINDLGHHGVHRITKPTADSPRQQPANLATQTHRVGPVRSAACLIRRLARAAKDPGDPARPHPVLYGTCMGTANSHSNNNLPVLLAGGGFQSCRPPCLRPQKNYPLTNLYVSMLQRYGPGNRPFRQQHRNAPQDWSWRKSELFFLDTQAAARPLASLRPRS